MQVKYRIWDKGLPPQKIKLNIPGWAGEHRSHVTGDKPQPWHCVPFVEANTYALELIYPYDAETRIYNNHGKIEFHGDFSAECTWCNPPAPPFSAFAPTHYGYTSCLDIQVPSDHVVRLEPHPRFFTDSSGECPIAVPGHIHSWWPRIFFVVFKSPFIGQSHFFRKGEPYAQILIVPKKMNYEISSMSHEESAARRRAERLIDEGKNLIASHSWFDHEGNNFDDKYKQLQNIFNRSGQKGLDEVYDMIEKKLQKRAKKIGRFIN